MSMLVHVGKQVIDLEKPVRLTKVDPYKVERVVVFTCEGILSEAPEARVEQHDVMRVHLTFRDGAEVDWCPAMGDVLENVAKEKVDSSQRQRVAMAVFNACKGRRHPTQGGEHWNVADRLIAALFELRTFRE